MKTIILGDTHGQDLWKAIVNKYPQDMIIFLGDYFDSFNIAYHDQMPNFLDIIDFKKANMDRVVLLWGNHDHHYQPGTLEQYSGYQRHDALKIKDALEANKEFIQVAYSVDKFLFTHAGLTNTWLKKVGYVEGDIVEFVNNLFLTSKSKFDFSPGRNFSSYGDDITQGPFWVRPRSLEKDKLEGYTHVVGHTVVKNLEIRDGIILTDTFQTSKEYLVIDNNKLKIKT